MIYQQLPPHPALAPYVKEYLLLHFDFTGLATIPTKLMPARPEHSLIFYPDEVFTKVHAERHQQFVIPHAVVQGQPLTHWQHHYPRRFKVVKVVFQLGGLYHLLGGLPLAELTDATLEAEAVLGSEISTLTQHLMNTAQYAEMINVVDTYLVQRFRRRAVRLEPIDKVSQLLQAPNQSFSLDYLAQQACLSYRQFERKFRDRTGVSPKLFARLVRFNKAQALKEKHPAHDWLTVALACGYADYQHLAKDFKQFAGVTPVTFLREEARAPEYVLHLR
ncbi:AraC family transcriptional regulator [Hymenobacter cavernae]|uniref:AraC family transcriptional regulator n=1 Tax=Hymenobacter cavernae TaxID=2044852 RepID=A0ABQ1UM89_9BACT|nr:helix-turn-helix domain-containing protein [Hymenobacter cavernae]GGF20034.1 AraC family transcriptional regulator [Hymenobacter cavernae]